MPPERRSSLRAFSVTASDGLWQEITTEIVPLDPDGLLRFFPDEMWRRDFVNVYDRLLLNPDQFGPKKQVSTSVDKASGNPLRYYNFPGCTSSYVFEIAEASRAEHVAYLAVCGGKTQLEPTTPVTYDTQQFNLRSPSYLYSFQPTNHMLFKEISLYPNFIQVAKKASMIIHNDIRNFFNLNLSGQDLESYLEEYRSGPLSLVGRLKFYLKILFFKIKLSLTTDASFFADSAHIPQVITIPPRAEGRLNPTSGILYSWSLPEGALVDPQMPVAQPKLAKDGIEKVAEMAAPYCSGGNCSFKIKVVVGNRSIGMQFGLPRQLITRGFFPQMVKDVDGFKKQASWADEDEVGNSGLYFETSGLPAGSFGYDFWLQLGDSTETCPRTVSFKRIL